MTANNTNTSANKTQQKRQPIDIWKILPLIVAISMTIISITTWKAVQKNFATHANQKMEALANDNLSSIKRRYVLYEESLRGGVGLFRASDRVTRKEWERYTEALEVESTLPGINGIGYIAYVEEEELGEYLKDARADGSPNFKNHPETDFNDKFVIQYIFPVDINKEAIGLDIGFEANRREAAEKSRDSGKSAMTRKILLVQDSTAQPGFLLLIPVYNNSDNSILEGWVYAPFIGSNFLKDIEKSTKGLLAISIYDGAAKEENLIYSSPTKNRKAKDGLNTPLKKTTSISLADKEWTVVWETSPEFFDRLNKLRPDIVLFSCLMLTGILSFLFFLLSRLYSSASVEAKRNQEKLAEAIKFEKLIKDKNPDLMFVKDSEYRIIDANQSFLNLYPKEKQGKVIGYTTLEEYRPEDVKQFTEQDRIAFETGFSKTVETLKYPNKDIRTLYTTKTRFHNSEGEAFILGVSRDITEIRQKEEQLISIGRILEESVNEIFVFSCSNLKFLMANRGARDNLMHTMEELNEMTPLCIKKTITEDKFKRMLHPLLTEEKKKVVFETTHTRKDNSTYEVEAHVQTMEYQGKNAFFAVVIDISDRKKYEKKITKYLMELERSNQELDEFAQIASHDLKEPLRGIQNHSAFLVEEHSNELDELGKEKLGRINFLSKKMERLVSDLLYYSKLGHGEQAIMDTDLNEVVKNLEETFSDNDQMELLIPEKLHSVRCNKVRITEALRNLISNSLKYNENEVKTIEIRSTSIFRNGKDSILLSIKDNGIGIDSKFHESIFRMFKRLHKESAYGGGSGAGLSFTKKIVERHGGEIWLESEKGVGTTFFISLPKKQDKQ